MSTVDLGVRVLLIDGFTSGFGGIASALGLFGSGLLSSGAKAASLEEKLSSLSGLARLAEADFAAGTITAAQYAERMDDISMQAAQTSSKLDTLHQTMLGMSIAAGAGVDLAIFGGALKMVVGDAMDLQTTMNKMIVAIHGAKENFDGLQQTLITVANNSVFTMKEVGDAFSALGQRGQDATAIMNGVGQAAIYLAEATGSKATPAAELLGTTMQAFGAKANEAERYASNLTVAFENGLPSIEALTQAYGQTDAVAHQLRIPIESLTAVLDVLGQHAPNAANAMTGLKFMLTQLNDPTIKAQKELSDLKIITISTTPAFYAFQNSLDAAAAAANKTPVAFDGTLKSLQDMFTQAQKLGTVHTDKSFYQWAISVGILDSKLNDSTGKFAGFDNAIRLLGTSLDGLPQNERLAAISDLLTQRSGAAGSILLGSDWKNIINDIDKLQKQAGKPGTAKQNAEDKTGGLEASIQKLQTSFHDLSATIGTPILQPLGQFFGMINQGIGTLTKGDKNFQQFLATFLVIGAGLSIVGVIVGLVVMAFTGLLGPIGIFLLIAAGVAVAIPIISVVLAALVTHLSGVGNTFKPLSDAFSGIGYQIKTVLAPLFGQLGDMVQPMQKSSQQFVTMVNSQFKPVMESLARSFEYVRPAIVVLVTLIGGVLLAVLKGLVTGIGAALPFLGLILGGVLHIVVGVVQLVIGFISLIVSLFVGLYLILTGKPEQAKAMIMGSFHTMFQGILNIVVGVGQLIVGAFVGIFVLVSGFIAGFVSGIINFFKNLADILVGHSIIPDMLRSILNWFMNIGSMIIGWIGGFVGSIVAGFTLMWNLAVQVVQWGWNLVQHIIQVGINTVLTFFQGLPGQIMGALSSLGTTLLNAGTNAMQMMANGISNGIGLVTGKVGEVATKVKNLLGFKSPTKEGPLADSDTYMPNMMKMYAKGIIDHTPLVHGAMSNVALGLKPATSGLYLGSHPSQSGQSYGGSSTHLHVHVGSKEVADCVIDHVSGQLKMNNMTTAWR